MIRLANRYRASDALVSDSRGATIVEFAIIAPVLCLLLMGAFDLAHTLYMQTILQGIVQKAARDSTLESGVGLNAGDAIDALVIQQVKQLNNKMPDPVITRRYYRTFSDAAAAKAEAWTDTDNDKTCDHGEPFQDDNNNGVWDKDGGNGGQGGAKDRTVYTVTVKYPHLFPIYNFIGGGKYVQLIATTVLENQPYSDQGTYGTPVVLNCP